MLHSLRMFRSETIQNPDRLVVRLEGDMDTEAAKDFASEVEKLLPKCGGSVELDLSGLDFISSGGLRQLLVVRKAVHAMGGCLSTTGVNAGIMQIFRLSNFDVMLGVK